MSIVVPRVCFHGVEFTQQRPRLVKRIQHSVCANNTVWRLAFWRRPLRRRPCKRCVPTFEFPECIEFRRRVVLVFRLCTVTSISSTFTSYRQHVAKVGVGKSVRHTSSVYTRSRGWHSHEVYCAEGSLRNLFSRVVNLVYKEFNRWMVFVSLLYTGHAPVRHPSRLNTEHFMKVQFPAPMDALQVVRAIKKFGAPIQ